MPKITRHGGPSIPPEEAAEVEGGEQPSAGSSTETSSEKPPTTPEKSEPVTPKRVRKTGSRSGRARTGSSSARSTDGGQTEAMSETDPAAE